MVCREDLIRSIRCAHSAITAYSECICDESSEEERAMFQDFALSLSQQLQTLRETSYRLYGVDPIHQVNRLEGMK